MAGADTSGSHLRRWLTERVADYLQRPADEIDPTATLQSYGFESTHALGLAVDIEQAVGVLVEPTLAWDFPTIDAIAVHLTELLARESS